MEGTELFSILKQAISIKDRFSAGNLSEMGWIATGQFFNVLLSFVIIKQISFIGTEGYGIYALIITVTQLSGFLLYGPGVQSFLRFYFHFYERGSSRSLVSVMYRFIFYSGASILLLGFIAVPVSDVMGLPLTLLVITLCTVYTVSFKTNEFFSVSLNMIRKRKQNSLFQISEKVMNIILLWIAFRYYTLDVYNVLIIFIITSVLFSLMKLFIFNKLGINRIESPFRNAHTINEVKRTLLSYAIPFIIWGLSGWFQLNSEKWIIAKYLSTSDVGIYALMMTLVNALIIIPNTIISDFSSPIIFQYFSDINNKEKFKTGHLYINLIIYIVAAFSLAASIITFFFGREIIKLISSGSFAEYWYLLPLFCIGTGLFYITQAMHNVGLAMNIPRRYLIPKILTGIIAIALNIIFVIYFGINGIAYSAILINAFYFISIWIINRRIMRELEVI